MNDKRLFITIGKSIDEDLKKPHRCCCYDDTNSYQILPTMMW